MKLNRAQIDKALFSPDKSNKRDKQKGPRKFGKKPAKKGLKKD